MFLKRIIKLIIIYLVVGNLLALFLFGIECVYHHRQPGLNETRKFVLRAMSDDTARFTPFKRTKEYDRLLKTTSVDSVYYFWMEVYNHNPGSISKVQRK